MVGRGNHYCIEVLPIQKLLEISKNRAAFERTGGPIFAVVLFDSLSGVIESPGIYIANGENLNVGSGQKRFQIRIISLPAHSYHSYGNAVARGLGAEDSRRQNCRCGHERTGRNRAFKELPACNFVCLFGSLPFQLLLPAFPGRRREREYIVSGKTPGTKKHRFSMKDRNIGTWS
jgi:hypothetical protein